MDCDEHLLAVAADGELPRATGAGCSQDGTAILLVARAVGTRNRLLVVLATAGLTAIGGAFGAGEVFVKNGQSSASLAMAVLTGVALLC